mmetsp:Transcript_43020/g.43740  ORF Transcript_43020/g.43740 Transcript_43020/m.43740 type:complete len:103 (-) Transcript_43020:931-1239(-)
MTIDRSRQGLSAELAFEYKSDAVTSDDGEDQVNATTLVSTDQDPCPTNNRRTRSVPATPVLPITHTQTSRNEATTQSLLRMTGHTMGTVWPFSPSQHVRKEE